MVSGTGGSIAVRVHVDSIPRQQQLIVMSPSGVQKERMEDDDMHVLSSSGSVLSEPLGKPWTYKSPKCSDGSPVFLKAYELRNAGAVIHSHGMESCFVTMINPLSTEFRITHMEMIKGIQGHGYYDELVVPIIERELADTLAEAIKAYPKTTAVLVRNHEYTYGVILGSALKHRLNATITSLMLPLNSINWDWTGQFHLMVPFTI